MRLVVETMLEYWLVTKEFPTKMSLCKDENLLPVNLTTWHVMGLFPWKHIFQNAKEERFDDDLFSRTWTWTWASTNILTRAVLLPRRKRKFGSIIAQQLVELELGEVQPQVANAHRARSNFGPPLRRLLPKLIAEEWAIRQKPPMLLGPSVDSVLLMVQHE